MLDRLPQSIVDKGMELAKGATAFGLPMESLTREELMALVALGWDAQRRQREEFLHDIDFLTGMR